MSLARTATQRFRDSTYDSASLILREKNRSSSDKFYLAAKMVDVLKSMLDNSTWLSKWSEDYDNKIYTVDTNQGDYSLSEQFTFNDKYEKESKYVELSNFIMEYLNNVTKLIMPIVICNQHTTASNTWISLAGIIHHHLGIFCTRIDTIKRKFCDEKSNQEEARFLYVNSPFLLTFTEDFLIPTKRLLCLMIASIDFDIEQLSLPEFIFNDFEDMKIIDDDILYSEIKKMKTQGESKFDYTSPLFPSPGNIKVCAKSLRPYLDKMNSQYKIQILKMQSKSRESLSKMTSVTNQDANRLSSKLPPSLTPDSSRITDQHSCLPSCNIS